MRVNKVSKNDDVTVRIEERVRLDRQERREEGKKKKIDVHLGIEM